MDPTSILSSFERLHDYFMAVGFAVARMTGLIIVMPPFTRVGTTGILRGAIAIAFALPVAPIVLPTLAGAQLTVAAIATLLLKEMVVGVTIGLVLGVPFWAAEAAGDVLDLQRGSTASSLIDPLAMTQESISGTLFGLALVASLCALHGAGIVSVAVVSRRWAPTRNCLIVGSGPRAMSLFRLLQCR